VTPLLGGPCGRCKSRVVQADDGPRYRHIKPRALGKVRHICDTDDVAVVVYAADPAGGAAGKLRQERHGIAHGWTGFAGVGTRKRARGRKYAPKQRQEAASQPFPNSPIREHRLIPFVQDTVREKMA
jgi:hypothetical protein